MLIQENEFENVVWKMAAILQCIYAISKDLRLPLMNCSRGTYRGIRKSQRDKNICIFHLDKIWWGISVAPHGEVTISKSNLNTPKCYYWITFCEIKISRALLSIEIG